MDAQEAPHVLHILIEVLELPFAVSEVRVAAVAEETQQRHKRDVSNKSSELAGSRLMEFSVGLLGRVGKSKLQIHPTLFVLLNGDIRYAETN